ncbi:MAG: hypothetical protein RIC38_12240, partial [Chromatocurvus sp.]
MIACVCLLQAVTGAAQTTPSDGLPGDTINTQLSPDVLRQQLQQATGLPVDEQTRLASELEAASETLESARELQATASDIASRTGSSEEEIARFEALIRDATKNPPPPPDTDMTLDQLEAEIQLLVAERRSASARRT